jgi:glycosyltransferase involved in cell wall biosynthesis
METPNFYAEIARVPRKAPKLVVSDRCSDKAGVSILSRIVREFHRFCDTVVFNSYHQRDAWVEQYPWLVGRNEVIYNGVDLSHFRPREPFAYNHKFNILAIGKVAGAKNGLLLVEALRILRDRFHLTVAVTWVGAQETGLRDRRDYLARMNLALREMKLKDSWTWLPPTQDVAELLQRFTVLVHPSHVEGLPNVVCEALACGCPVIVSNAQDHPRLVEHEKSGLLFAANDPTDLARSIKVMHDFSAERRMEMGKEGRRFAEAHLSVERFASAYERLFERLLKVEEGRPACASAKRC